jgi:ribonuclease HI
MQTPKPHFLLFSESSAASDADEPKVGHWRFRLESVNGDADLEAADDEPEVDDSTRLELLAVVRGLEALDQPSRVTLVTSSRYVSRGLRFGLDAWRGNDWQWERYGKMTPVNDQDLWRRVDHAMQYHSVECRTWRVDAAHDGGETANPRVIHFPRREEDNRAQERCDPSSRSPGPRRFVGKALRVARNCLSLRMAR